MLNSNTAKISWHNLVLLLFIFIAFFYGMTSYAILDNNEGLYAEIAREMFATHNYLIPHLNYVPYLEKPPLLYWLIALSYHIFGVSTFAARLIPSLSSAIVCFTIYCFAKKVHHQNAGWVATLILASSLGFMLIGRVIFFDMLLTAQLAIALMLFYLWEQHNHNYYLWGCYLALAGGFLTKGMVAIALPGGIAIAYLILRKAPLQKFIALFNPAGIALFLLVILPWHIMASLMQPGFAWDYFVNEQFYRFLNKRIPHDYYTGPIYYYLPRIIVYLLPWSLLIPTLFNRSTAKNVTRDSLTSFLWLWFLIPLIFFSISQAKANYYMVVSMPALALLLGLKINTYIQEKKNIPLLALFCSFWTLLLAALLYAIYKQLLPASTESLLITIFAVLFAYGIASLLLIYYSRGSVLICVLTAGLSLLFFCFFLYFKALLQTNYTQIELADYIRTHNKHYPIYLYQDYEEISSLLFFMEKRLPIIDSISKDLYFGASTNEAKGWFISSDYFAQRAKTQPCYVAIVKHRLKDFQSKTATIPFCIVAENGSTYLLTNNHNECQS